MAGGPGRPPERGPGRPHPRRGPASPATGQQPAPHPAVDRPAAARGDDVARACHRRPTRAADGHDAGAVEGPPPGDRPHPAASSAPHPVGPRPRIALLPTLPGPQRRPVAAVLAPELGLPVHPPPPGPGRHLPFLPSRPPTWRPSARRSPPPRPVPRPRQAQRRGQARTLPSPLRRHHDRHRRAQRPAGTSAGLPRIPVHHTTGTRRSAPVRRPGRSRAAVPERPQNPLRQDPQPRPRPRRRPLVPVPDPGTLRTLPAGHQRAYPQGRPLPQLPASRRRGHRRRRHLRPAHSQRRSHP